ncbi:hypothetical protein ISG33_06585 [Glaciecola sp. MH2013]|uniref:hypothetical protein n=1 Tax=Glaciecola sp. MH2013 TaxID=2785524 RepID=UPI0018A0DF83|nr:hypothetical protein [Glaciecola sp. MH2013]MBF7073063.1 hypothetical protein [Glaciecola sp. MH2013]
MSTSSNSLNDAHTNAAVAKEAAANAASYEHISTSCLDGVSDMQISIGENGSAAQNLALAKNAERCVDGIHFDSQHPHKEKAMQLKALAVMNFIKAGDSKSAKKSFDEFIRQFPQQDLFFSDYSSFVDTATALLNHKSLSKNQLMVLNINQAMRDDLVRQYHWRRN